MDPFYEYILDIENSDVASEFIDLMTWNAIFVHVTSKTNNTLKKFRLSWSTMFSIVYLYTKLKTILSEINEHLNRNIY